MSARSITKRRLLVVAGLVVIAASSLRMFLSQVVVEASSTLRLEPSTRLYCRNWLPADGCMWEIGGNGKQVRALPPGVSGEPSRQLHSGHRWFAHVRPSGGRGDAESAISHGLCVMRDDGLTVALPLPVGVEPLAGSVRWPAHAEDRALAWIGRRRDASGDTVEGGIYMTRLEYDKEDGIVGGKQHKDSPLVSLPLVTNADSDQWGNSSVPDAESHDWSPDGKSVVLVSMRGELSVVEVDAGAITHLSAPRASGAAWSPDGSLIAFKIREPLGGIAVVGAKGGTAEVVFGPEQGIPFAVTQPQWLPAGCSMIVGYLSPEHVPPGQPAKPALVVLDLVKGRYETIAAEVTGSVIPVASR